MIMDHALCAVGWMGVIGFAALSLTVVGAIAYTVYLELKAVR